MRLIEPKASVRVEIGDHPLKPGGAGAFDHGIALGGEIRKIEVAMTVDQHARPRGSKSSASM